MTFSRKESETMQDKKERKMSENLKEPNTRANIVLVDNEPIGYIQSYPVDDKTPWGKKIKVADNMVSIDYFIGDINYIHKGQPSKGFMKGFRIVSSLVVFIGAGMEVSMLWNISDVLMGVMALINIPVILILSNTALKALADYEKQKKNGGNPVFRARDIGLEYETDYWG